MLSEIDDDDNKTFVINNHYNIYNICCSLQKTVKEMKDNFLKTRNRHAEPTGFWWGFRWITLWPVLKFFLVNGGWRDKLIYKAYDHVINTNITDLLARLGEMKIKLKSIHNSFDTAVVDMNIIKIKYIDSQLSPPHGIFRTYEDRLTMAERLKGNIPTNVCTRQNVTQTDGTTKAVIQYQWTNPCPEYLIPPLNGVLVDNVFPPNPIRGDLGNLIKSNTDASLSGIFRRIQSDCQELFVFAN